MYPRLTLLVCASSVFITSSFAQQATVVAPSEIRYVGGATNGSVSDRIVNEGSIRKTGAGDLALPLSKLSSRDGRIDVIDGTLTLTADGTYETAEGLPVALQQKAALWLEANTNVVTILTNSQLWVQQWLDVREPNAAGPYQYLRAVSKTTVTNDLPILVQGSPFMTNGMAYIDFGTIGSGRWMAWQNAASNLTSLGICNVFIILSARESYGFTLGSVSGQQAEFHISDFTTGTNGPLWTMGG